MDVGFPQQFAKLSYLRVPRVQFPKAPLMECVRLVEEPVLKTVGLNRFGGSIPSHSDFLISNCIFKCMIHYVYEIKNIINDKIYVGKHSTENIDDGYMGSGKYISAAIKKHGLENFRKRIIKQFETAKEALEFERQLVNEEFVKDVRTYNLSLGGKGGWGLNNLFFNNEWQKQNSPFRRLWQDKNWSAKERKERSKRTKKLHTLGVYQNFKCNWNGRKHTEETKKRIGEANSKHQTGKGNSQFGTCWIYNKETFENRKIKAVDIQSWISQGWIKGRFYLKN